MTSVLTKQDRDRFETERHREGHMQAEAEVAGGPRLPKPARRSRDPPWSLWREP